MAAWTHRARSKRHRPIRLKQCALKKLIDPGKGSAPCRGPPGVKPGPHCKIFTSLLVGLR
ncbi:hypothetical protein GCM10009646_20680 [Streptomyces aureus]